MLLTAPAWARLGGGESYSAPSSGGYSSGSSYSSSSSSSSSGGNSDLVFFLLELILRYPAVGIPVTGVVVVIWLANQSGSMPSFSLGGPSRSSYTPAIQVPDADLFHVRPHDDENPDPNFSYYVFRDFVGLLFSQVQRGRTGDLGLVGHYLAPDLRQRLLKLTANQAVTEIRDPIVGAARILGQVRVQNQVRLTMTLETNYTEVRPDRTQRVYTKERWTFVRKQGVLSPGPTAVGDQRLGCPNCGQSGEVGSDGRCPYCDKIVNQGDYGWVVSAMQVTERQAQLALGLGQQAPERGTELPTQKHPQLGTRMRTFRSRYPQFQEEAFRNRVVETFMALQKAWSDQDWGQARPYETDSLYQTHRYWIEAYQAQGAVNELSQIECHQVEICNLDTDAFFDAITVRVFASMIDVTREKQGGKLLGGDPKHPRKFTEYWTFIRKVGFQAGTSQGPGTCPSCGAPLDRITQAGRCEYCGSLITKGDFDWVLAQIEQDESYKVKVSFN